MLRPCQLSMPRRAPAPHQWRSLPLPRPGAHLHTLQGAPMPMYSRPSGPKRMKRRPCQSSPGRLLVTTAAGLVSALPAGRQAGRQASWGSSREVFRVLMWLRCGV